MKGLQRPSGDLNSLSTQSAESMPVRLEDGCILWAFLPLAMFLPSPVILVRVHTDQCSLLIISSGHDSSISIVYPSGPTVFNIRIPTLPFVTLIWTAEDSLVAAGHDCQPVVFSGSETGGWASVGSLDDSSSASKPTAGRVGRLNSGAFATFQNADSRGLSGTGAPAGDTKLSTVHQNTITSVRSYEESGGRVTKVSTSGVDGNLVIWDVDAVSAIASRVGGMNLR